MTKVMLVEDDATMRQLLKTLLEIENFQVVMLEDASGNTYLDKIRNSKPDMMLLDVHLRDINGIDLMRQIHQDAQLKTMRVLMASGMDLKDKCLEAGANGFLMKPYMPDELISWLRKNSA